MRPAQRIEDDLGQWVVVRSTWTAAAGDAWHPRHVTSTLLIGEGGVNVTVVQERLGHHSHSFTADTYQHVIPGMDAAAADRFDQLVFGDEEADEGSAEAPQAGAKG